MYIEIKDTSLAFNYERLRKFTFRKVSSISFEVTTNGQIRVTVNTMNDASEEYSYCELVSKNAVIQIEGE